MDLADPRSAFQPSPLPAFVWSLLPEAHSHFVLTCDGVDDNRRSEAGGRCQQRLGFVVGAVRPELVGTDGQILDVGGAALVGLERDTLRAREQAQNVWRQYLAVVANEHVDVRH